MGSGSVEAAKGDEDDDDDGGEDDEEEDGYGDPGLVALPPSRLSYSTDFMTNIKVRNMQKYSMKIYLSHHDLSDSSKLSPPIKPTRASSSFCGSLSS